MTARLPDPTPQAQRAAQRLRNLLGFDPPSPAPAPAEQPRQDSAPDTTQAPNAPRDDRCP